MLLEGAREVRGVFAGLLEDRVALARQLLRDADDDQQHDKRAEQPHRKRQPAAADEAQRRVRLVVLGVTVFRRVAQASALFKDLTKSMSGEAHPTRVLLG